MLFAVNTLFVVISLILAIGIIIIWFRFKKQIIVIGVVSFIAYIIYKLIFKR